MTTTLLTVIGMQSIKEQEIHLALLKEIKDKFNPHLPNCLQRNRNRWGRKGSLLLYPTVPLPEIILNIGNIPVTFSLLFFPSILINGRPFTALPSPVSQRHITE